MSLFTSTMGQCTPMVTVENKTPAKWRAFADPVR
jgi:hypothetical protein